MTFKGKLTQYSDIGRHSVTSSSFCDFNIEENHIEIISKISHSNLKVLIDTTEIYLDLVSNRDVFINCNLKFEVQNEFYTLEFNYSKSIDEKIGLFSSNHEEFSKIYFEKNLVKLTYIKMAVFVLFSLLFPFYAMLRNTGVIDAFLFDLSLIIVITLFFTFNLNHKKEIQNKSKKIKELINKNNITIDIDGHLLNQDEIFYVEIWEKIDYVLTLIVAVFSISVFVLALLSSELLSIFIITILVIFNMLLIYNSSIIIISVTS